MINEQLIHPKSIVVVGGSNNIRKPGGNLLHNLIKGKFAGDLYVVNPREEVVQGVKSYHSIQDIPETELAVLAIPATFCVDAVRVLAADKGVKAFIIISAGFGEQTHEGAIAEERIIDIANEYGASVIGPNCIGLVNRYHHSVFTSPVPELHPDGVDLISSSGGTALFVMEAAMLKGLRFNSLWSVGNARQIGVEDVLAYMDRHFDPKTDSRIKLIYVEFIKDPDRLLYHASSLIEKGCKIAAIKSGTTESGSRAASSHTGAIASSDSAVEALFRKAGIVRCYSREELATVAGAFYLKEMQGKNFAVVTHAGGPAVILSDALSKGGLMVPPLNEDVAVELRAKLLPGAATSNPIDILGTGTANDLEIAIDYCENRFDEANAIAVIFGSTGLGKISDALEVIHRKMESCRKPIFPILPSIINASEEVNAFIQKGHVNFSDEVELATAVSRIINTPKPACNIVDSAGVDVHRIRQIIDSTDETGYLKPETVQALFAAAGIEMVCDCVSSNKIEVLENSHRIGFPIVAKVVGPVHKSDIGGVVLNIKSEQHLSLEFDRLMKLPDAQAVMIQPMLKGQELFVGGKYEERFGHVVLCGLGGIFVEVLQDVASGLAPLSMNEANSMIRSLRAYKIIKGTRGQQGIDRQKFAEVIVRLSILLRYANEIKEVDINPLLATEKGIVAVDARVRLEK
jgi:Acyl-CoA synthetase (NDP forming)